MSLFGGESAPGTDTDTSGTASNQGQNNPSSLSIVETASPNGAQNPSLAINPEADDTLDTGSSNDADGSSEEEIARPHRFAGPPQTWRGHTTADRQIVASLDQLRDSNLAAHLYNAHALKRRARRPTEELAGLKNWLSRDTWLRTGENLQYTDASGLEQTELVPSKDWTAWPLDPAKRFPFYQGPDAAQGYDASDEWDIGGVQANDPAAELREEIMAIILRIAKDNWKAKETFVQEDRGSKRTAVSRSRSRPKSVQSVDSHRSTSQGDTKMRNGGEEEAEKGNEEQNKEEENEYYVHVANDSEHRAPGKKRGRKAQTVAWAKPVFLADDAIASRLLKPSINSMLTKLDELAIAVQRTRLNHLGHGQLGDISSQSDFTSAAESTDTESRSLSESASRRQASENSPDRTPSRTTLSRMAHAVRDNAHGKLENREGTDHDSIFDDASDASDAYMSRNPDARKRARSASTTSTGSGSVTRDRARAGLIDWSEVLALAAVKGWNEQALSRTAQRCATLFDEGMSFMPLDADAPTKSPPQPVQYAPSIIPPPQVPSIMGFPVEKRPFFQVGTLRCPHEGCFGHGKDFASPYRAVEHCIRVHGYDPRNNDENNEARTMGGVQLDGFLLPVTVKQGWLGHGRSKAGNGKSSKKQKVNESVEDEDAINLG